MADGTASILTAIGALHADYKSGTRDFDGRLREVEKQLAGLIAMHNPGLEERVRKLEFASVRYGVIGTGIASAFGIVTSVTARYLIGGHHG